MPVADDVQGGEERGEGVRARQGGAAGSMRSAAIRPFTLR